MVLFPSTKSDINFCFRTVEKLYKISNGQYYTVEVIPYKEVNQVNATFIIKRLSIIAKISIQTGKKCSAFVRNIQTNRWWRWHFELFSVSVVSGFSSSYLILFIRWSLKSHQTVIVQDVHKFLRTNNVELLSVFSRKIHRRQMDGW